MTSDLFSHIWGANKPDIIFYLPSAPELPAHWQAADSDAITQLIALNGNHWRKIVTIMSKICCVEHDINMNKGACWKLIRDNLLSERYLPQGGNEHTNTPARLRCQLRIVKPNTHHNDIPLSNAYWHILCGKEVQQRLGMTEQQQYTSLDKEQKIRYQQTVLLTPYLDYRQYSNALIEQTRQHIAAASFKSINRK